MSAAEKKLYQIKQDEEDRRTLDKKWDILNKKVQNQNPSYRQPQVPFASNILIRDYNQLYAKVYDKERLIQV